MQYLMEFEFNKEIRIDLMYVERHCNIFNFLKNVPTNQKLLQLMKSKCYVSVYVQVAIDNIVDTSLCYF